MNQEVIYDDYDKFTPLGERYNGEQLHLLYSYGLED